MCSSAVAAVQRFGVSHKTPHQDRFSRCGAGSSHIVASCMLACLEFAYIYIHTTTDRHINVYIYFSPLSRPCGGGCTLHGRGRGGEVRWGFTAPRAGPASRPQVPGPPHRVPPPRLWGGRTRRGAVAAGRAGRIALHARIHEFTAFFPFFSIIFYVFLII